MVMTSRKWNFSAGPAVLPESVLEEVRDNLLSLGNTGIGILEHSHRGKAFLKVYEETVELVRRIGQIPPEYEILFLQGGASLQFAMIPMNWLGREKTADYWLTGAWSEKAREEALRFGKVHVAASSEERDYAYIPEYGSYSEQPAYVHYTSNNTIFGTQFRSPPAVPQGAPLICDASSDFFSRPWPIDQHAMIYAGAQKNLGPAGVTLVIIRRDWLESGSHDLPTMLQYRTHAKHQSMYNTPPTFAIYVVGLVMKWILEQGGLTAIAARNERKANMLYDYLERSRLFRPTADKASRSLMNVTFITGDAALDQQFCEEATRAGFDGLKGHRSVGGMRASIYNAFPENGVRALVDFMRDFESRHCK